MKSVYLLMIILIFTGCDVVPIKTTGSNSVTNESSEFKTLMERDQINKDKINAEVLTYLLNDSSPLNKNTGAIIENQSNCNIIVRLAGISTNQIYNLPVRAKSKNQFVIKKGNYTLRSKICNGNYYSQKNVSDVLSLKLSVH